MDEEIISRVWQLHGAIPLGGYEEGILKWSGGNISFTTETGEQFNVPLSEVKDVKWPFYEMGLEFTAHINNKKYRFLFGDPYPGYSNKIPALGKVDNLFTNLDEIISGRDAANKWKAVLRKR